MTRFLVVLPIALGSSAAAQAPGAPAAPATVIQRAVAAAGGEPALRNVASVSIEFNAATFGLGQEETSRSPARATLSYGRFTNDWRGNRRASVQEQRPIAGGVTRLRQIVAGDIGLNETNGVPAAMAANGVAALLQGMRLQPDRLLLRALDDPRALSPLAPRLWRGEWMDGVRFAQGADTVSLYFDRLNGLLTVAEQVTDDPILGDRRAVTWYTRWQEVPGSGVKLPRQFDSHTNDRLLSHNVVTAISVNVALPDSLFAIPDSIARRATRAPAVPSPAPITVTLVELAPGVWRAEGGTHHSLVIEQNAQLVVVEAPQSNARFRAVLDTLKARFPARPIGLVVNTHHHWDHAGGVRTALAAGLRVATHQRNVAFVRDVAAARKTVAPEALSRRAAAPGIVGVRDSLVIGSGDRRVVLYQLPTSHVEGMLAAYVPSARLLFASDVLSPPLPPASPTLAQLGSAELLAMVKARGISVDRFAGGHGGVVSWNEVERAARP